MDKDVVRVVFRVWRDNPNDLFALFPDVVAHGPYCTSYTHIGQHSAADYAHCIAKSRPATVREYTPLANELKSIGYQLQIRSRR